MYEKFGIDESSESVRNTYMHTQNSKNSLKPPQNDLQENQEKYLNLLVQR